MSSFDTSIEDLPGNVMADVLSRLPVKEIIHSKCVCKNWRELVSDSYFVKLHLSRSPGGIIIHHNSRSQRPSSQYMDDPGILKWWEPKNNTRRLFLDPVMNFDLNRVPTFENSKVRVMGSVNGLVCFGQCLDKAQKNTCICNPVTREYTILPLSQHDRLRHTMIASGFGIGLLTKEYKVIRIFQKKLPLNATSSQPCLLEAEVYTLGKGQWRQLGHVPHQLKASRGTFLNGSIHWIVLDEDSPEKIYAFDIDNETFHLFPSPPPEKLGFIPRQNLGVMNGFLSLCYFSYLDQFTVWVMKEYGIKRSWHKEVVIKQSNFGLVEPDCPMSEHVYLVERSKHETILMIHGGGMLCLRPYFSEIAYRPSFLKLQTFESESVHVL